MLELFAKLIEMVSSDQFAQTTLNNFHNASVHFYSKDKNGKYLSCNDEMACAAGLNKSVDIAGQTDFDFVWSEGAPLFRENDQKVISRNEALILLEPYELFDGNKHTKVQLLSYKQPLRARSKKIIGIFGISIISNMHELGGKKYTNTNQYKLASQLLSKQEVNSEINTLTTRQIDCLYYLVKGMGLKEIAYVMNLSPRTVEHHFENIKIKLNCNSRSGLVAKALQLSCIKERL